MSNLIGLGDVEIELKSRGRAFLGLGRIRIGGRLVRSGELPIRPFTATLDGIEYDRYEIDRIEQKGSRAVIHTRALGTAASVRAMLDHSLDPIWHSGAWDGRTLAQDRMEWVLQADERVIAQDHIELAAARRKRPDAEGAVLLRIGQAEAERGDARRFGRPSIGIEQSLEPPPVPCGAVPIHENLGLARSHPLPGILDQLRFGGKTAKRGSREYFLGHPGHTSKASRIIG